MLTTTSWRRLLVPALVCVGLAVAAVVVLLVASGGRGGNPRAIGVRNIPLPAGTRVMAQVRSCDRGVHPYCAVQVVLTGRGYPSSGVLRTRYQTELARRGWTTSNGPDGNETAADSPGHELHLTYATAYEDLLGIDSNWIQRAAPISRSLAATMFDRMPALSIMLIKGSS